MFKAWNKSERNTIAAKIDIIVWILGQSVYKQSHYVSLDLYFFTFTFGT